MLIPAIPSDAGAAPLPGSATFPAPPSPQATPVPSLSATAAAPAPPEALDQALAKHLTNLKVGISRLTADREALAERVEQFVALNFETAEELARAREEQAREAARAAARAESSAAGLKQLQERIARLSGQFQELQSAMQQGAARNAALAELARRAQDELTQLARERSAALARAEEATARLLKMRQERDALRGELAALAAEKNELLARVTMLEAGNGKSAVEPARAREASAGAVAGAPAPRHEEELAFADIFPEEAPLFPEEAPLPGQQSVAEPALEREIPHHFPPIPEPLPELATPPTAAPVFPTFPGFGDDFTPGGLDLEELPTFVLQPGLQSIECRGAEEVVSLYHPVNVANLSLDGKGQEICQGYICCIRRGEKSEVFAAIVGIKSGRIRIYAPEEQPRDEGGTARALRGAVVFGEQVGLVIEEKSGEPAGQRMEAVRRCPVFKFTAER